VSRKKVSSDRLGVESWGLVRTWGQNSTVNRSLAIHRSLLSMQARLWTHDFWRPVFTGIRGGWDEIRLQMDSSDTCSKGNTEVGFLSWRSGHCDEVCQYRKNWLELTYWHSLGRISSHQSWTYAQSGSKRTAVNMERVFFLVTDL